MATWQGTDCGYQHKKTPPDVADSFIAKARRIYVDPVEPKAPRSAKSWLERKDRELDGLIAKAVAGREDQPQKMDAAEYAAYRRSLGRR